MRGGGERLDSCFRRNDDREGCRNDDREGCRNDDREGCRNDDREDGSERLVGQDPPNSALREDEKMKTKFTVQITKTVQHKQEELWQ
jgi:hypothetical protein